MLRVIKALELHMRIEEAGAEGHVSGLPELPGPSTRLGDARMFPMFALAMGRRRERGRASRSGRIGTGAAAGAAAAGEGRRSGSIREGRSKEILHCKPFVRCLFCVSAKSESHRARPLAGTRAKRAGLKLFLFFSGACLLLLSLWEGRGCRRQRYKASAI